MAARNFEAPLPPAAAASSTISSCPYDGNAAVRGYQEYLISVQEYFIFVQEYLIFVQVYFISRTCLDSLVLFLFQPNDETQYLI